MQRIPQKLGETRVPERETFIKVKLYILFCQILLPNVPVF